MIYQIRYLEKEHREEMISVNLPGCTSIGDVIRLANNLYKIQEINRQGAPYVKVSFHKEVEKGPRRQTRR